MCQIELETILNLAARTGNQKAWLQAGAGPAAEAKTHPLASAMSAQSSAAPQVIGQTGPVAPGLCGEARIAVEGEKEGEASAPRTLRPWSHKTHQKQLQSCNVCHYRVCPCFCVFEALTIEWEPPTDNGGADLVAYRLKHFELSSLDP